MFVTKRQEIFYRLEMTEDQMTHLLMLLQTGEGGHVNELKIAADRGPQMADEVNETIINMREVLEKR